jgi:DNA replication protein DnaC
MTAAGAAGAITNSDWFLIATDQLEETRSVRAVRAFVRDLDASYLVLTGVTGCGKTVASVWGIAQVGGYYLDAKHLERTFASQFGEPVAEQQKILSKIGLVVIDDVGTETNRETFMSSLFEVLNRRQGGGRKTILTANETREHFLQAYGDARIASRLKRATFVGDASGDRRSK